MAQPLRRSVFSVSKAAFTSKALFPSSPRYFSQHAALCRRHEVPASERPRQSPVQPEVYMPANTAKQEADYMRTADLGLLPDTFIRPTGSNAPKLFQDPRSYLWVPYKYVRERFVGWFQGFLFVWLGPKKGRFYNKVLKLENRQLVPRALQLHQDMWVAFARGDIKALSRVCVPGIGTKLCNSIVARSRNEQLEWELVRMLRKPKLVMHRVASVDTNGTALRQAIVRIRSVQKLTRFVNGKVVGGTGIEKDCDEYFVIDQRYVRYQQGPWRVWGTATETVVGKEKKALAPVSS